MAGYTDSAFRKIVKSFSPEVTTFSEMISTEGLSRNDEKSLKLGNFSAEERPFVIQIFGSNPDSMAKSVRILENKFNPDGIDLNFACPVKKILKSSSGGFLLKEKDLALRLASTAVKKARIPISVKTRLGFATDNEIIDFSKKLENVGISSLAIHGRTVKEGFLNQARWKNIYEVKKNLKIPVFGNGDIKTLKEVKKIKNLDGVFIGRGSLGKPWFLAELEAEIENKKFSPLSFAKKIEIIKKHTLLCLKEKGEKVGLTQMRSHFAFYFRGFPGASSFRQELMRVERLSEFEKLVSALSKKQG